MVLLQLWFKALTAVQISLKDYSLLQSPQDITYALRYYNAIWLPEAFVFGQDLISWSCVATCFSSVLYMWWWTWKPYHTPCCIQMVMWSCPEAELNLLQYLFLANGGHALSEILLLYYDVCCKKALMYVYIYAVVLCRYWHMLYLVV